MTKENVKDAVNTILTGIQEGIQEADYNNDLNSIGDLDPTTIDVSFTLNIEENVRDENTSKVTFTVKIPGKK